MPSSIAPGTSPITPDRSCICARSWNGPGAVHPESTRENAGAFVQQCAKQKPVRLRTGFGTELRNLLYRGNPGAQAGFVPRAGVLVDHPVLHRLVDHGDGVAESGFRLL